MLRAHCHRNSMNGEACERSSQILMHAFSKQVTFTDFSGYVRGGLVDIRHATVRHRCDGVPCPLKAR